MAASSATKLAAIAVVALASCRHAAGTRPLSSQPMAQPIGSIDGEPLTTADLGGELSARLGTLADDYAVRRFALTWSGAEDAVAARLLAAEAARRGMTVEALVQEEVTRKVGSPSDDEIQGLYQAHHATIDAPLAEVADALREKWHEDHVTELRRALVDRLRSGHEICIDLPPPALARHLVGPGPLEPRGRRDAPVTVVVFGDYNCPFSAQARRLMARLTAMYPDQVRYLHRDLPGDLDAHHHPAQAAAYCANEQHKFWPMFDLLFERAPLPDNFDPLPAAEQLALDLQQFRDCLASPRPAMTLLQNQRDAARLGIEGTPALFVNGMHFNGPLPVDAMARVVEREITEARP